MTAPRLNRKLVLERKTELPDGAGGRSEGWREVGTLWGEMTPRAGREVQGEGGALTRSGVRIIVRAAPAGSLARPRVQDRFASGTRRFEILAVQEDGPAARYLICTAEERASA